MNIRPLHVPSPQFGMGMFKSEPGKRVVRIDGSTQPIPPEILNQFKTQRAATPILTIHGFEDDSVGSHATAQETVLSELKTNVKMANELLNEQEIQRAAEGLMLLPGSLKRIRELGVELLKQNN